MSEIQTQDPEVQEADLANRLAYTFTEAARLVGLARNTFRDAHSRGEFKARKSGKRWLVSRRELLRWLESDNA